MTDISNSALGQSKKRLLSDADWNTNVEGWVNQVATVSLDPDTFPGHTLQAHRSTPARDAEDWAKSAHMVAKRSKMQAFEFLGESHIRISLVEETPVTADAIIEMRRDMPAKLSLDSTEEAVLVRAHRMMWFALVAVALAWGLVAGASVASGQGLGARAVAFGCFGTLVLAASLYRMGREPR